MRFLGAFTEVCIPYSQINYEMLQWLLKIDSKQVERFSSNLIIINHEVLETDIFIKVRNFNDLTAIGSSKYLNLLEDEEGFDKKLLSDWLDILIEYEINLLAIENSISRFELDVCFNNLAWYIGEESKCNLDLGEKPDIEKNPFKDLISDSLRKNISGIIFFNILDYFVYRQGLNCLDISLEDILTRFNLIQSIPLSNYVLENFTKIEVTA